MKIRLLLTSLSVVALTSCGPSEKAEDTSPADKVQTSAPAGSSKNELTPQQKEELEIDEANVMNPFPG